MLFLLAEATATEAEASFKEILCVQIIPALIVVFVIVIATGIYASRY